MTLDEFMNAISGRESGGNYGSVNADSGASGRFQIMPANWPSWSRAAGLPPGAPMTPQNQDLVARHQMQQYYNAYGGNWGAVAAAWYGGDVAARKYLANPNDPYLTRMQGKYPSIAQYISQVLGGHGGGGGGAGHGMPQMKPNPLQGISAPQIQQQGIAGALAASRPSVQRSMATDLTRLGVPNLLGGQQNG